MGNIYLKKPTIEDLKYRKMWIEDPKTMDYNKGFDLDIKGYNKSDGTFTKTDEEMKEWYSKWIDKEPDKYYAYIYSKEEYEPVGEVYYYPEDDTHRIGILIYDKYRGKGYSYPALKLLEERAFNYNNIDELTDMLPITRTNSINLLMKAGFIYSGKETVEKVFDEDTIIKELIIKKDMYESKD